jgi:cellulose synthase/poly-beta-1,6-N-acetylglucosamine synthase-like glycosyltransferase
MARRARNGAENAERLLSMYQVIVALLLLVAITAYGIVFGPLVFLQTAAGAVIVFYLLFIGLKLHVSWASVKSRAPEYRIPSVSDPGLPRYTVLVPVYREGNVITQLLKALSSMRYPSSKLEIIILLEPDDAETLAAVNRIALPENFRILVVPGAGPRTKPKACNAGYEQSNGDVLVIFDAEDRPDPDQLLRAVGAFRVISDHDPSVGCLQAQLAFWNPRGSWISSFYWADYVVHFQTLLAGLSRLDLIPPLGGTSNHFRMEALDAVARANGAWQFEDAHGGRSIWGPWDPYNVTEDADLAFRLALAGFRIGLLDSQTYEEAPDAARKARNQRGRWLQGYMQTGLVHTRHPMRSMRRVGPLRYLTFITFILGTPVSLLLNPIVWGVTILYIASRLAGDSGWPGFIDSLFPAPVYYVGMLVTVAGNLILYFQNLVIPLRRQQETRVRSQKPGQHPLASYLSAQEYGLTARLLLTPLWWAFTSLSAYRALRKLVIPSQRSHWDKTPHGHALATEAELEGSRVASPEPDPFAQLAGIQVLDTLEVTQPLRAVGGGMMVRSTHAARSVGRPDRTGQPGADIRVNDTGDPGTFRAIRETSER